MIPRDFYHHPLTVGLWFKLLVFGLLAALLCVPLASAMHAFGHAFFGMAAGCRWTGVLIPFDGHAQALVNYPSIKFPDQNGFWWLQQGGFLWTGALLLAILFFPAADELLQNLFMQVLGFHLAFWGMLKEAASLWPLGEARTGVPLSEPNLLFWAPAAVGLLFSLLFAARAIRILGQGVHFAFFTPFFLGTALWFFPSAGLLVLLIQTGAPTPVVAVPGAAVLAFLLLSPLLHPGSRLWREPRFARWLYGLALAGTLAAIAAVVVLGWGGSAKPILWGTLQDPLTPTVGVTR